VAAHGCAVALERAALQHIVATVATGEATALGTVSVTFLSAPSMRALNRRALARDRVTDVIAFAMAHGEQRLADLYVCPAQARAAARRLGMSVREELVRLVVHGLLHAAGHDHPAGAGRTRSPMWRRQERYVRRLMSVLG